MKNQLLLLEDIQNVGRKGDLVKVKPGYARNFLLPQRKALVADKSVVKIQARLKEERAKQSIIDKKASEEVAEKLKHLVITHEVKVDSDGHMYGSVTAKNIVEFLAEEKIEIERRMVSIEHSIKQLGTHTINLKLKEGVEARFNLKVIPEGGVEIQPKVEAPQEDVQESEKEAEPEEEG